MAEKVSLDATKEQAHGSACLAARFGEAQMEVLDPVQRVRAFEKPEPRVATVTLQSPAR